ncbi:MAG TPA: FadR family transcriptional regulator [Candidatus Salinicoccus stercoripullorum]|uniref:FadR family transcriptional regulator n=1 Tax=Candidatus Salinicoccus stercoripullorum TaxID=2838756 RepID=A0A9D1QI25_9STAP|nr:FadR family transcriptional regulator [Candidatus Salinicoccus stercoripullorum]
MKPIRKEKLSELIYENIVGLIKDGEYEIGSKLPSENELAAYYKVSRAPVREAISQLISMGYVESSQGRGTYVKNISAADEIKEYIYGKFDKKELFDLLEMRTILEVQSARLAAERRTAEDLMKIEAALEEFKKITQNQRIIGMKADYDFHEAIIISTENDFMIQTFNNLQSVHRNALEFSLKLNIGKPRKREMVYSEHAGVFEAIKNGDAEIASRRMKEHLFNMRRKLGDDRI